MESLNYLAKHINECEVRREKYTLPDLLKNRLQSDDLNYNYPAIREPPNFTEPLECTWAFMKQEEIENLLQKKNLEAVKAAIDKKLSHGYPKSLPRMIASELLYGGFKFAKNSNYNAMQTGAFLSMLYMTHRYFNSCHRITAEDVFWFFKELLCYHSLEFVPSHKLIFNPDEAHLVLSYFCKIFLRHLPIIRLLGLPNFELAINTYIPPFPTFKKQKTKKDKKEGKKTETKGKDKKKKKKK